MTRQVLIAGNWKMNGLQSDGAALSRALVEKQISVADPNYEMLVCPPFTLIGTVVEACVGSGILVGGQDCHGQSSGAHTGDTSAAMLRDAGCAYVIVGHSERRSDHGESDALIKQKAEAALSAGLRVIVCIGETLAQREAGKTIDVNTEQLRRSLPEGATRDNTVIAYEPVWAIGTGKVATPAQAQEVHGAIRAELSRIAGPETAAGMRILYGGSMKPDNARELLGQADIDGGLIGGASLSAEDFFAIAAAA